MKFIGTKLKRFVTVFAEHFQMAQVTTSAAVLAYYTLLSIFPAVLVVGNLLPMLGLDAKTVLPYLQSAIPSSVYQFIRPIIFDFLRRGSGGILTTGALVALWSTSQGIAAFQRSVNGAYGVAKNQNPIINRVLSFIWMIIVIMIIFALVIMYGLGEQVLEALQPILHFPINYVTLFSSLRWPVTFGGLFIFLTLLYYFVPNARVRLRYVVIGALVATLLWMGLSRLFSYYAVVFAQRLNSYKTIGAFILMMMWLDFSGMIVMIGAIVNATCQVLVDGPVRQRPYFWQWVHERIKKVGGK